MTDFIIKNPANNHEFIQTVHSQPSLPMQRTRLIQNAEMSDEERFIELFRLLDEKDDEINKLSQIVTKLEHQLGQIREDYTKTQRDNDKLQISLERAQVWIFF